MIKFAVPPFVHCFDAKLWRETQDKVRQAKLDEPQFSLYASDLEDRFIEGAKTNALSARVEKYIHFEQKDFFESTPPQDSGTILCNLPYGERISGGDQFLKKCGDHLKKNYKGWKAFLLMPGSAGSIGLKPNRKISLKNGTIAVKLCEYDIF